MSRPPRLGSADYLGQQSFFLTICCYRRRVIFVRPDIVEIVLQQFVLAANARDVALTAYCFMPDHVHALVAALAEHSDFTKFVSLSKQRSGYHFKRVQHTCLWQEGPFDRVLRSDEPEMTVIRYIVSNPIRARIVQTPQEYLFWGSQVDTRDEILEAISRS
ncbi:MAG TPA: transposase [Vicinamibacterales bacterium]|nr:transposase [Vicinamibacterales bacterium]